MEYDRRDTAVNGPRETWKEALRGEGDRIGETWVVGLRFHLEMTPKALRILIEHCGEHLDGSELVLEANVMLSASELIEQSTRLMARVLSRFLGEG